MPELLRLEVVRPLPPDAAERRGRTQPSQRGARLAHKVGVFSIPAVASDKLHGAGQDVMDELLVDRAAPGHGVGLALREERMLRGGRRADHERAVGVRDQHVEHERAVLAARGRRGAEPRGRRRMRLLACGPRRRSLDACAGGLTDPDRISILSLKSRRDEDATPDLGSAGTVSGRHRPDILPRRPEISQ